jgi:nickel/cobalt transporter (NicO) family protein
MFSYPTMTLAWVSLLPEIEGAGTSLFSQPWLYAFSAFVLGALHALQPGHGKAIVGAYLVGSRGRTIDAVLLGIIVTMTHTAGVFVLGALALFASAYLMPQTLSRMMAVVGGVLIIGVGLALLRGQVRGYLAARRHARFHAIAGASIESPAHEHAHGHDHFHGHGHDHGHTHQLPDRPGVGALLALGISGGIVPCPAALALMLAAIANGTIAAGIGLVMAFSLGLTVVLVAIGVVLVHATRLAEGRIFGPGFARASQAVSAVLVLGLGIVVTAQAVLGTTVVPIP